MTDAIDPREPQPDRWSRREAMGGAAGLGAALAAPAGAQTQAPPVSPPLVAGADPSPSLLYPHPSVTRSVRDLSGLWDFQLDPEDRGEHARWFDRLPDPRRIPVPCSWNDLFDDAKTYFGAAWYATDFEPAPDWTGRRVHLRFGSAVYRARVWLNGRLLGEHVGGHLPFAFDVTPFLRSDGPNRLAVMVENRLEIDRVPAVPGTDRLTYGDYPQTTYDFFPYSGLHRPVWLVTLPQMHLRDVTVRTARRGAQGVVEVALETSGGWTGEARLILTGGDGTRIEAPLPVARGAGSATLTVPDARLWSPADPFLYRLSVELGPRGAPLDRYALDIGVRTIAVAGSRLLLNDEPVQLKGFGKHEDFPLHGRGLDLAALVRDFQLLRWIGANSFRTSHYPYSEEAMMLADREGFLVIDEGPGVSLVMGDPAATVEARRAQLSRALAALVARDKNHPSVILWSVANEPLTRAFHTIDPATPDAVARGRAFFESLFVQVRAQDPTRPVCLVSLHNGPAQWVGLGDVICTNSYNGWYSLSGRLAEAEAVLETEIAALRRAHGDKPVIFTEFGADAVAGVHSRPPEMWSEEYQAEVIALYLRVLARHDFVVGAHPWAFADFKTPQSIVRVGGLNCKGVFTRARDPKLAAHRLRAIWRGDVPDV